MVKYTFVYYIIIILRTSKKFVTVFRGNNSNIKLYM